MCITCTLSRRLRVLEECRSLAAHAEGQERLTSMLGWDVTPMTAAARREAAEALAPLARNVCLNQGTERPFTGATANGYPHDCKNDGVYACALGGLPLFDSKTKFDSGTGCACLRCALWSYRCSTQYWCRLSARACAARG